MHVCPSTVSFMYECPSTVSFMNECPSTVSFMNECPLTGGRSANASQPIVYTETLKVN